MARRSVPIHLVPGRVYRTEDFLRRTQNPTRLAARLVAEGRLERLGHGLFFAPRMTRFGAAPPSADELLRALLKGDRYRITGPERWNALGLGATAISPNLLIYNRRRTGTFTLGGLRLELRRVEFPTQDSAEWYVIDLLENLERAAAKPDRIELGLTTALAAGRFRKGRLLELANRFGTRRTRERVERALTTASDSAPLSINGVRRHRGGKRESRSVGRAGHRAVRP